MEIYRWDEQKLHFMEPEDRKYHLPITTCKTDSLFRQHLLSSKLLFTSVQSVYCYPDLTVLIWGGSGTSVFLLQRFAGSQWKHKLILFNFQLFSSSDML